MTANEKVNENQDIFREDWLACLRAHYLYTLRANDLNNAEGLRRVLSEAGIGEAEIEQLALDAGFAPISQIAEIEPLPLEEVPDQLPIVDTPATEIVIEVQTGDATLLQSASDPIPDTLDATELSEAASPLPEPPSIARDLFSWQPPDDPPPVEAAATIEPIPPAQPSMLPLPLTDAATTDHPSAMSDKLRLKPKPKAPKQRSLF